MRCIQIDYNPMLNEVLDQNLDVLSNIRKKVRGAAFYGQKSSTSYCDKSNNPSNYLAATSGHRISLV